MDMDVAATFPGSAAVSEELEEFEGVAAEELAVIAVLAATQVRQKPVAVVAT